MSENKIASLEVMERVLLNKYGESLTQKSVAEVMNITQGAVSFIKQDKLPRTKKGESRTNRVYYNYKDVAKFIVEKALKGG